MHGNLIEIIGNLYSLQGSGTGMSVHVIVGALFQFLLHFATPFIIFFETSPEKKKEQIA